MALQRYMVQNTCFWQGQGWVEGQEVLLDPEKVEIPRHFVKPEKYVKHDHSTIGRPIPPDGKGRPSDRKLGIAVAPATAEATDQPEPEEVDTPEIETPAADQAAPGRQAGRGRGRQAGRGRGRGAAASAEPSEPETAPSEE